MNKKIVIGLTGLKGSGKDTAANALLSTGNFVNIKFADPLKNMMRTLLSMSFDAATVERYIEGDLKEVPCNALGGCTARHAMQTLGTEWGRDLISETLWVDTTMRRIANATKNVIITDMRFENEYNALKEIGATTVRVERGLQSNDLHPSETFIRAMTVDHEIKNDGTIGELCDKITAVYRDMLCGSYDNIVGGTD